VLEPARVQRGRAEDDRRDPVPRSRERPRTRPGPGRAIASTATRMVMRLEVWQRLDVAAHVRLAGRAHAMQVLRLQVGQTLMRSASMPCWARRLSRRDFDVFFLGTAMKPRQYGSARLELVPQPLEHGPPRVGILVLVTVRFVVEFCRTSGESAQSGRQRILSGSARRRIASPGRQVEPVVDRRASSARRCRGSSPGAAQAQRLLDDRVAKAAHARAVRPHRQARLEGQPVRPVTASAAGTASGRRYSVRRRARWRDRHVDRPRCSRRNEPDVAWVEHRHGSG
jgi:hypothetical protein